jgi:hypothetical protein
MGQTRDCSSTRIAVGKLKDKINWTLLLWFGFLSLWIGLWAFINSVNYLMSSTRTRYFVTGYKVNYRSLDSKYPTYIFIDPNGALFEVWSLIY